jgi:hypothetical protein
MEDFDNNEEELLSVIDMEGCIDHLAGSIAEEYSPGAKPEDVFIFCSRQQIESIINESCLGFDENDNPIINREIYAEICDNICQTVQNASLAKLASEGYLECAWDNDLNDMVFWLPDEPK